MHHQGFGALEGGGEGGGSQAADLLGVVAEPGRVQGGGEAEVVRLKGPGTREVAPLKEQAFHCFTSVLPGVFIVKSCQVIL